MRQILNTKFRLLGLATAFVMLFGLAFLAGSISSSHNAALAQANTPGQTAAPTQTEVPDPTAAPGTQPNSATEGVETADGPAASGIAEATEQDSDNQAALQAQAKITVDQAKQVALAKVPGTALSATLEDENGTAVYAVTVTATAGGASQEVKVNAVDGTVLKVEASGEQGENGGEN